MQFEAVTRLVLFVGLKLPNLLELDGSEFWGLNAEGFELLL